MEDLVIGKNGDLAQHLVEVEIRHDQEGVIIQHHNSTD
jgi:hypothetical protein